MPPRASPRSRSRDTRFSSRIEALPHAVRFDPLATDRAAAGLNIREIREHR